jgi:cobalamin synthase
MDRVKEISFFLVAGYALVGVSAWLQSGFLMKFLTENLIVLLVALMAINTTTRGVVMTKLKEISDKVEGDFSKTIEELRKSVIEQIWYLLVALACSILQSSALARSHIPYLEIVVGGLLASVFVASLANLYDTAQSIFVILRSERRR